MNISDHMETVESCILCGPVDSLLDERFGRLLGLVPPYAVRQCTQCGLRWLSPRPSAEGYKELYAYESYFDGGCAVESYAEVAKGRLHQFGVRVQEIERRMSGRQSLSILDIGAGTGDFLAVAARRGHSVRGVELSDGARGVALEKHGLTLEAGPVDTFAPGSFDAIHMNHVLEHMPDPRETIRQCYALLRPGGLLVIEVPQQLDNDLDRLRRLFKVGRKVEFNAYSLHHTYFFTPDTVRLLLEREHLSVLNIATARWSRTPLRPFSLRNLLLGSFLWVADKTHRGGNVIEIYAMRE